MSRLRSGVRGRSAERGAIDALLARARAGRGGCLVLRGEPGIGKTALLRYAAARAYGMQVLRTVGVEPEVGLRYAALQRLLLPELERIGQLPEPQARGIGVALGLRSGPPPEPFLVALATLSLLTEAARDRPLLCLVDDAHWVDAESLDALGFAARRLAREPIALALATRSGAEQCVPIAGLVDLTLAGLDQDNARALLVDQSRRRLSVAELDALLPTTGGNPQAIRELAATGWCAGVPFAALPLAAEQQRAFLSQVRDRDLASQQLLLLVAVDGEPHIDAVRRAAEVLRSDVGEPLATDAVDDLLIADGPTISFRHPLVRSAIYYAASPAARRAAHQALATALSGAVASDPAVRERWAWHLGQAAEGPDEPVAAELERSGEQARWRMGPAVAAVSLARAAELSPEPARRVRRLAVAAASWWQAGDSAQAARLLESAEQLHSPPGGIPGPDVAAMQALTALRTGSPSDAVALLQPVVADLLRTDRHRGVQLLLLLGEACIHANTGEELSMIADVVEALALPGDDADCVLARLYRAACRVVTGAEPGLAPRDLAATEQLIDPTQLCRAGELVWVIGDQVRARRLRRRAVERARAIGATGTLAWALGYLAVDELECGRFDIAEAHAEAGHQLARETGQPNTAHLHRGTLALVAAARGREREARQHADAVLAEAGHRLAGAALTARKALGLLELAAGRPDEALAHLEAIGRGDDPTRPGVSLRIVPELVEAAVRAKRPDRAADPLKQFTIWADATGAPHLLALAARSRALLEAAEPAPAGAAEAMLDHALTLHTPANAPFELARTELLLGEHLRRARRRADARPHLRAALEMFHRLGASMWADRARNELRAAGESEQPARAQALAKLTPQEQRIAAAVGEGATNREIAGQLFLSPRTVDYHLRKIFQKAGISSRAELIRLTLTEHMDPQL